MDAHALRFFGRLILQPQQPTKRMTSTDLQSLAERVFECNLAQDYATSRKLAKDVQRGQWAEFDALVAQLAREHRQSLTQTR